MKYTNIFVSPVIFLTLWLGKPCSREHVTGWLWFVKGISRCRKGASENLFITCSVHGTGFPGRAA